MVTICGSYELQIRFIVQRLRIVIELVFLFVCHLLTSFFRRSVGF